MGEAVLLHFRLVNLSGNRSIVHERARISVSLSSMKCHGISAGDFVEVSLSSNPDDSNLQSCAPSGRTCEGGMEGSPRSNLVAEAWPATDLEEGTAALTSCLLSSLRLVGNLTSNEVQVRVLKRDDIPKAPCDRIALQPLPSDDSRRSPEVRWLHKYLSSQRGPPGTSVLELLASRLLAGRVLAVGSIVTLPVLGQHVPFSVITCEGQVTSDELALVAPTTAVTVCSSTPDRPESLLQSHGSRLEAQSKGLVERAAAAAAAALQEEGGGEEGPGAAAARRAAQAGASSTSDGLGSLGGVQNHISTLRSVIKLPAVAKHLFQKYAVQRPRGVLLWGPPGTGKTCLARAAAADAGYPLFLVNGPDLVSQFVGDSEAGVRGVFAAARACAPAVILIDELDALAPSRGNLGGGPSLATTTSSSAGSKASARIVSTLLEEMDGMSSKEGGEDHVVVLATTNRPAALDAALRRPGRFDREIEIGPPSPASRADILRRKLQGLQHCLDPGDVDELARVTHGYVGADLSALCQEAALAALQRFISSPSDSAALRARITLPDFQGALSRVQAGALREMAVEVPKVRWNDIGGYEAVKQRLKEAVAHQLQPHSHSTLLPSKGLKGVLLFGPPGCSKTLLAKALATESGLNFISVKASDLLSKYVGESEKAVASLFSRARQAAPAIIFIDELDGLTTARDMHGSGSDTSSRVLSQLLTELDGLQVLKGVLLVAATNRPDHIDAALLRPGRFDRRLYVPPPNAEERLAILRLVCREAPLSPDVNLSELALGLEGRWATLYSCRNALNMQLSIAILQSGKNVGNWRYTGADLQGVYREAALQALSQNMQATVVELQHFHTACQIVKPTGNLAATDLAIYHQMGQITAR